MKERLIYFIYAILVIAGVILIFALIQTFLPSWVYWTCLIISAVAVFWQITKPEKYHYWMITCKGYGELCVRVIRTKTEVFSLKDEGLPFTQVNRIISVTEIDKYTYDLHMGNIKNSLCKK